MKYKKEVKQILRQIEIKTYNQTKKIMTTANISIVSKTNLIDELNDCQLRQGNDGFYMTSPKTGNHFVGESTYNERVRAHWAGFLKNNGVRSIAQH
jgi:hypothetical protein